MVAAFQQFRSQIFQSAASQTANIPAFFSQDVENNESVLNWVKDACTHMREDHQQRTAAELRNVAFYAGVQSSLLGKEGIPRERVGINPRGNLSKLVVNKIVNLNELWVSKITRYAPAVAVMPTNSEYSDKVSAKLGQLIIDNLYYEQDMERTSEDIVRFCRLTGNAYLFIEWDPDTGDYATPEAAKENVRVPLTSSDGTPVTNAKGEQVFIDPAERIGDVTFTQCESWFVLLHPMMKYKDCDWLIRVSFVPVDELKADYPEFSEQITSHKSTWLNYEWLELGPDETPVYELFHRSTPYLNSGRYVKLTEECVLENSELPYSHGELPVARLTNLDVPTYLYGISYLANILTLQVAFNNLFSMAYTNLSLGSHAYWLVPASANMSVDKIRNSTSVLKYMGAMAPRLETFKTVSPDLVNGIEMFKQEMTEISGHQGLSQGDPPPGVDAAVALGILEEQENQRANSDVKKYNAFHRKTARLALSTAQDFYKVGEKRLVRIVGKGNQDTIKALDIAKFSAPYDVRIFRSTSLSESKSVRLQQLILIKDKFPNAISDERFMDLMEFADDKKIYDITTSAVRAAESENEAFYSDEEVAECEKYEQHLSHWEVHTKWMQTPSFKTDLPEEIKLRAFDHVCGHEMEMYDMACVNMSFANKLMAIDQYPSFFVLPCPLTKIIQLLGAGQNVEQALQLEKVMGAMGPGMGGESPIMPGPMGAPAGAPMPDASGAADSTTPQNSAPPPMQTEPQSMPDGAPLSPQQMTPGAEPS